MSSLCPIEVVFSRVEIVNILKGSLQAFYQTVA